MLLYFLFKVNWLLMSCWCFVGCELCWFVHKVHKVHCVKTIVLKVNLKCMTICQLARKDNKCTHTPAIQHIHPAHIDKLI